MWTEHTNDLKSSSTLLAIAESLSLSLGPVASRVLVVLLHNIIVNLELVNTCTNKLNASWIFLWGSVTSFSSVLSYYWTVSNTLIIGLSLTLRGFGSQLNQFSLILFEEMSFSSTILMIPIQGNLILTCFKYCNQYSLWK